MSETTTVVLVICADRAMQEALREIVTAAGCRMLAVASVAAAERRLQRQHAALVLVDPLFGDAAAAALGVGVVEIPVRTSATGVRRIARQNRGAVRWLKTLLDERGRAR